MKVNQWTAGLAAAGVVSLGSVVSAEETPSQVMTALASTTLSGYVDTSVIWKPGTGNTLPIPGRAFDGGPGNLGGNKMDGFNLNVVKLQLEKPLDEGNWSAGYKVSLLFGPDANAYNTSGTGLSIGGTSDFSLKDAYVNLRAPVGNGLDFKVGTFTTPIGYEVFESPDNPNYSRSYGWQLEPTQHTGILASYQVSDVIGLSAGIANTWTASINARSPRAESHKTYMGTVTIAIPEDSMGIFGGSYLYGGVVDGFAGGTTEDTTHWYAGHTMRTPIDGLNIGVAFDYRDDGVTFFTTPAAPDSWAWATAFYASYQASEKMRINGRVDYTRGSDGTFYDTHANGISDHGNELLGLTLTTDYTLWDNVLTRLEARWDHAYDGRPFESNAGVAANKNVLTLALNLVYRF